MNWSAPKTVRWPEFVAEAGQGLVVGQSVTRKTISAPAISSFRGSIPHPTQPLCTLRVRRHRRLTQHSLPGGPLQPYLGRTCTG
jgi:hypothetical protein